MKNNKKGFIAISIIYSFFILFITIMMLIIYSYVNDRKINNKIKSDIINGLRDKSPDILVSMNGSSIAQTSYTVNVKVLDGGNGIVSAKYKWSPSPNGIDEEENPIPDVDLPSYDANLTSPTDYGFYFLIIKACDANSNCKTVVTNSFLVGDPYICIRAQVLHNETCTNTNENGYCLKYGLSHNSVITYGSPVTEQTQVTHIGDAYTCDVNGDGTYDVDNERFYLLKDYYDESNQEYDENKAVLIFAHNVHNGVVNNTYTTSYSSGGANIPSNAASELPSTTQWSNVSLFSSSRTIEPKDGNDIKLYYEFDYTGGEQTFTAPYSGNYKLELWGASGGGRSIILGGGSNAGPGGYAVGTVHLTAGETIYLNIGGQGVYGAGSNAFGGPLGGYNGGGAGGNDGSGSGGGATHIATSSGILSSLSDNKSSVLIVAGGGGGSDNDNGGGDDNGTGGSGGGFVGGNAIVSGRIVNNEYHETTAESNGGCGMGGNSEYGYQFGQGESVTYNSDTGGAGGGYYGGYVTNYGNGGGAGGSGYIASSRLTDKGMSCTNCTVSINPDEMTALTSCISENAEENCAKVGNGYIKITSVSFDDNPASATDTMTYTNKAARLPNYTDIYECFDKKTSINENGAEHQYVSIKPECSFLLENTKFANSNKTEGYFLENPYYNTDYVWTVNAYNSGLYSGVSKSTSNKYGVRPVIEVEKVKMQI